MEILGPIMHDFKPHAIMLLQSKSRSIGAWVGYGFGFADEGHGDVIKTKEETPQNLTPKSIEELVEEVLGNNKIVKCFKQWQM